MTDGEHIELLEATLMRYVEANRFIEGARLLHKTENPVWKAFLCQAIPWCGKKFQHEIPCQSYLSGITRILENSHVKY